MLTLYKTPIIFMILATILAMIGGPVYAFEWRKGDKVAVGKEEIVNDDLYLTAKDIVIEGTINGDLFAFAKKVTINGTINGDFFSGAQTLVINGSVTGDIRMAGSALFVGEQAKVGGDILSAGYSLELRKGATIGRDLLFAGAQTLVSGKVTRDAHIATAALNIEGSIGRNLKAHVGEPDRSDRGFPMMFMPKPEIAIPDVPKGLTLAPGARIGGNLEYTQSKDLTFPAGVILGTVTRTASIQDVATPEKSHGIIWVFFALRSLAAALFIGFLLLWLTPLFLRATAAILREHPGRSFTSGLLAFGVFLVAVVSIVIATILAALLFGVLTLGALMGVSVGIGLFSLFGLIVGFIIVTVFIAKVVFGVALGEWILTKANSPLAGHKFAPMLIGVATTYILLALLCLPFIPGFIGGLLKFLVTLFGLGAIWIWGRERFSRKPL